MVHSIVRRAGSLGAVLLAAAGVLLLVFGSEIRDQAALLAAVAFLCSAFGTWVGGGLPAFAETSGDPFESIAWGRFFVALVYASLAVVCFAAMAHAPDFGRFVHSMRAVI